MATIPIPISFLSSPLQLTGENETDILQSSGRNVTVVRRGGNRYRYRPNIRSLNILTDGSTLDEIMAFLESDPTFDIPCLNWHGQTQTTGTIDVANAASVGATSVNVRYALTTTPSLPQGSYVVFNNKSKIYRIRSESRTTNSRNATWTLTFPLRQALTTSVDVVYTGTDGKSNAFDGVLGSFVNERFGDPVINMSDGVLAEFLQLDLIENI